MPKVSIVIPVYNVAPYIRQCLESVLNQTLHDIEIICVDDGSTDQCPEILDEYARKDNRVKVIHKANSGYGHSMNVGMDASTGEYFAILESDDMVAPMMYEELYRIAKCFDLDIVKADFCRFLENNGLLQESRQKIAHTGMYNRVIHVQQNMREVLQKASLYTWSGIYRMKFLREKHIRHNETPGASYQDNGFWFLTVSSANKIYFYDEVFYKLRRDNPNSSFFSKKKVYCIRDEYDYILKFLRENSAYYEELMPYYWWARLGAYHFNLFRIAPEYREEFLRHFRDTLEMANSYMQKELYSPQNWNLFQEILKNPSQSNRAIRDEFLRREGTASFLRRLIWCYQDNGVLYTIGHVFKRILRIKEQKSRGTVITKADIFEFEQIMQDQRNRIVSEIKMGNIQANQKWQVRSESEKPR